MVLGGVGRVGVGVDVLMWRAGVGGVLVFVGVGVDVLVWCWCVGVDATTNCSK